MFERLYKTENGKSSHQMCEINKQHKTAKMMHTSNTILPATDVSWKNRPVSKKQAYSFIGKE